MVQSNGMIDAFDSIAMQRSATTGENVMLHLYSVKAIHHLTYHGEHGRAVGMNGIVPTRILSPIN